MAAVLLSVWPPTEAERTLETLPNMLWRLSVLPKAKDRDTVQLSTPLSPSCQEAERSLPQLCLLLNL